MKGISSEAEALKRWGEDVLACVAFLTRMPVGSWATVAVRPLSQVMWAFPIVGALLGICGGLVLAAVAALGAPPLLAAAIALACLIALTGALHEDGFADLLDGFGGGQDREDVLAIMRDSRIGTFGVLGLVLVLIAKATSLGEIVERSWYVAPLALAGTSAFSRAMIVWLMGTTPPARPDGLSASAGQPGPDAVKSALLIGAIGSGLLLLAAVGLPTALLALILGWGSAAAIRAITMERIGGQTGDVCGAVQVISETVMLAAIAIMLR
jgi:adenosylcobinamide-GDP ribazoletransferase